MQNQALGAPGTLANANKQVNAYHEVDSVFLKMVNVVQNGLVSQVN
jgi:hypothetical protein